MKLSDKEQKHIIAPFDKSICALSYQSPEQEHAPQVSCLFWRL